MAVKKTLTPKEKMRVTDSLTFIFDDLLKMKHKINNLRDRAEDITKRHGKLPSMGMLSLELESLYKKEQSTKSAVAQVMRELCL